MTKDLFLGFGSNMGERLNLIIKAFTMLIEREITLQSVSSLYLTEPLGNIEQNEFLNCVGKFEFKGDPHFLLEEIKAIERSIGRVERFRWGPREIDIDILLFGEMILTTEKLSIPHKDIIRRKFVLVPLLEIDEELRDPRDNSLFSDHLESLGKEGWPELFLEARLFEKLIELEVKR
ncbi:2-amino-4-hydroxy-6-hydroxymethyldihydropteridine pyrophosphokinase [Mesotoga sp. HF07.pep.5.2.highcov]|uniref:2-amino-4-hydroxy-6- hydroxymethyldihydropteridine diphosphokinase n=1 Tax=Mesotoga sp. HF07.pep.5.2.highcov TaxID=1462923 RepID=UPI000EF14DAD|nr:2-amino-4-hydroxy-6-hydroxymethyldihydropteridine diphosphokinase [Mesotoga sp. HF07.pep.5.2.highcov]RLL92684.1 2-amino-4-hydroxy-6-hydroxymethyldihydropteridine pyrophosphokinase [Mesotoga sp. HF07.pep.5.2.highcov]